MDATSLSASGFTISRIGLYYEPADSSLCGVVGFWLLFRLPAIRQVVRKRSINDVLAYAA